MLYHNSAQRRYCNWCWSRKPSYGSFEELSHANNEVRLASASVTRIHMHFVAAYFEMDDERLFPPWVGCCECIAAIPRNILLIILINFNLFQLSTPKLKIFLFFIPQLPTYTAPSQKGTKQEEQDIQNYYLIFGERWGGRQNQILRAAGQCTRGFGSDLVPVPQVIIWKNATIKRKKNNARIVAILSWNGSWWQQSVPKSFNTGQVILSPYLWLKPILFFSARPTRSLL